MFNAQYLSYRETAAFKPMVTDYVEGVAALKPFYNYPPDINGIKQAIASRNFPKETRSILKHELLTQYEAVKASQKTLQNIESLSAESTFTICTAHQPNIFTGHLYFIYKIIHAIKLSDELNEAITNAHFVPVFYMGTEDADLAELGNVIIKGKKHEWQTAQTGAVGRMKIDAAFLTLVKAIEGELSVLPYGKEIVDSVKRAYTADKSIAQATFEFVNELFTDFGLVVLQPDNRALKQIFSPVIKKELTEKFSNQIVVETIKSFPVEYKAQVEGREINLFYISDDSRERIESNGKGYSISGLPVLSHDEMLSQIDNYPERFSPNVVLRPLYQEMILPNAAFIGGGAEISYWLELKVLFESAGVPFPMLVLRNSFMIISAKAQTLMNKLALDVRALFKPTDEIIKTLVREHAGERLKLEKERSMIKDAYRHISQQALESDPTLEKHVSALEARTLLRIEELIKKMIRAEKRKYTTEIGQVSKVKATLFPDNGLQERSDNYLPYHAQWGKGFINAVYQYSTGLEHKFCVLTERKTQDI